MEEKHKETQKGGVAIVREKTDESWVTWQYYYYFIISE